MLNRSLFIALILQSAVAPARAQQQVTLPPPKTGTLANLTRVMVPEARTIALSETHGLLAFCHEPKHSDSHVSLVKLDAKGNPAAYTISWKIPHPPGLVKHPNFAVSAAFHPKLPLLYVWHDFNLPYSPPPMPEPPDLKNFDHLLIYNIGPAFLAAVAAAADKNVHPGPAPELVASLCRGPQYLFGFFGGQVTVDATGEYLYLPNVSDLKNRGLLLFGRYKLDADGLPFLDDAQAKQPPPVRAKAVTATNPIPHQITPFDYVYLFPMNHWGAGNSFIPLDRDAILSSSYYGVMTWRPNDKTHQIHGLPLKSRGQHLLGAHPTLPAVFATAYETDSFSRFEQSDGYVTGLPRQYSLPDRKFTSPPAVFAKGKQLAIGGQHHVHVFNLDDQGYPHLDAIQVPVFNPLVKTLVYSEKFDRLYVGVELSK